MLESLRSRGMLSPRKARLFAVAVCRCIWHLTADERSRKAVDTVERAADGQASVEESLAAAEAATAAFKAAITPACQNANHPRTVACAAALAARRCSLVDDPLGNMRAAGMVADALVRASYPSTTPFRESRKLDPFLRDIFFNPFQAKPAFAEGVLAWNDGCVVKLATGIYKERAFTAERMGVLADAMEEAGVTNEDVLGHLRGPGPHCRRCWVIDLLASRETSP
jgi:hypothetical protein